MHRVLRVGTIGLIASTGLAALGGIRTWQVALVVAFGVLTLVSLAASLRLWRPVQGADPRARAAEARLWSTRTSSKR